MNERCCLRCDWQGRTAARTCPRCAEPLYELGAEPRQKAGAPPPSAAGERSGRGSTGVRSAATSHPPPHPAIHPPEPARTVELARRSGSLVAFVAVALVLAVVLGSWLKAHTPAVPAPAPESGSTRLSGTLVYAVPDGRDRSRLWRWDLSTGRVFAGPRVQRAIQLVDAAGASPGWIGVTSELVDGRLQASVLRFLGREDRPTTILAGDIVSWGPGGATVAVARRGSLRAGCRRDVSIVWAKLVPALRERRYADPGLCGDVLSLGLDDVATFFTLERGDRVGVFLASVGRIRSIVPGYVLVAVSPLSDMIVAPAGGASSAVTVPARPAQEGTIPDPGLFFRGAGRTGPVPFVATPPPFVLDRVLAWAPGGLTALVEGRVGPRRGVYVLDTGPGDGLKAPRFVGAVDGVPYATFTADGTAIVETYDGVFVMVGDAFVPLETPAGAPSPAGPIVWLP